MLHTITAKRSPIMISENDHNLESPSKNRHTRLQPLRSKDQFLAWPKEGAMVVAWRSFMVFSARC